MGRSKGRHVGRPLNVRANSRIVVDARLEVRAPGVVDQIPQALVIIGILRHCYGILRRNAAVMFAYGHSADDNDAHISRAIFASEAKRICFGVYKPDDGIVKALDRLLPKYQKTTGSSAGHTFFESESAKVWDV